MPGTDEAIVDRALAAGGYPPPTDAERAQLAAYWSGVTALRDRVDRPRLGEADPAICYPSWRPEHD